MKTMLSPPLAQLRGPLGDAPRTLVLVIGESTQQRGPYGLAAVIPRETTPELDALHKTDGYDRV